MVIVVTFLKSFLLLSSSFNISVFLFSISFAVFSTSSGKPVSKPCPNTIAFISTLCSPFLPNTSSIFPSGFFFGSVQLVILTNTFIPSSIFSSGERIISMYILWSSGAKNESPSFFSIVPTNCVFARFIILVTSPRRRSPSTLGKSAISTVSLFRAVFM